MERKWVGKNSMTVLTCRATERGTKIARKSKSNNRTHFWHKWGVQDFSVVSG